MDFSCSYHEKRACFGVQGSTPGGIAAVPWPWPRVGALMGSGGSGGGLQEHRGLTICFNDLL